MLCSVAQPCLCTAVLVSLGEQKLGFLLVTTVENRIRNGNGTFSASRELQGMGGVSLWLFLAVMYTYHIGFVFLKNKSTQKTMYGMSLEICIGFTEVLFLKRGSEVIVFPTLGDILDFERSNINRSKVL